MNVTDNNLVGKQDGGWVNGDEIVRWKNDLRDTGKIAPLRDRDIVNDRNIKIVWEINLWTRNEGKKVW